MSESSGGNERERKFIAEARDKARVLYEGKEVAHRSCGICLAETFGLPSGAYQVLRRGGITGRGTCGALRAGEMVLGQVLGDPDPTGSVTEPLREAVAWYQDNVGMRIDTGGAPDVRCNTLVRKFDDFHGPERAAFCTRIAAEVAAVTAEALLRFSPEPPSLEIIPIRREEDA